MGEQPFFHTFFLKPIQGLSLERRIFFYLNLISITTSTFFSVYDFCIGNKLLGVSTFFAIVPIYVVMTYFIFTIKNSRFIVGIHMLFGVTLVTFSFFNLNGFSGPFALDLLNLFTIATIISNRKSRPLVITAVVIYALILISIELINISLIKNLRPNDPPAVEIAFLVLRMLMTLTIALNIKVEFERDQVMLFRSLNEVERKNQLLSQLYEEVRTQKDSLADMNLQLEKLVENRTTEILKKNEQLLEYAFYNSHKVRGPLARVIGLVYLLKMHPTDDAKLQELIDRLGISAHELDEIVKTISHVLEEKKDNIAAA